MPLVGRALGRVTWLSLLLLLLRSPYGMDFGRYFCSLQLGHIQICHFFMTFTSRPESEDPPFCPTGSQALVIRLHSFSIEPGYLTPSSRISRLYSLTFANLPPRAHSKGKRAIRLSIIGQKINVITGAENIKAIWQNKVLDSRPAAIMMLQSMLQGRDSNALRYWQEDDSGAGPKAHPLSKVASDSRIYHPTWKASHQFLTVKNSEASAKHIQTKFQDIMTTECGGSGTTTIGDLRTFMQTHI